MCACTCSWYTYVWQYVDMCDPVEYLIKLGQERHKQLFQDFQALKKKSVVKVSSF